MLQVLALACLGPAFASAQTRTAPVLDAPLAPSAAGGFPGSLVQPLGSGIAPAALGLGAAMPAVPTQGLALPIPQVEAPALRAAAVPASPAEPSLSLAPAKPGKPETAAMVLQGFGEALSKDSAAETGSSSRGEQASMRLSRGYDGGSKSSRKDGPASVVTAGPGGRVTPASTGLSRASSARGLSRAVPIAAAALALAPSAAFAGQNQLPAADWPAMIVMFALATVLLVGPFLAAGAWSLLRRIRRGKR